MTHGSTLQTHAEPGQDRAASQAHESHSTTASAEESRDTLHRAEEMVDRLGERVGYYTSWLGRQMVRLVARAREEAEDMWAEAQNIRRAGHF